MSVRTPLIAQAARMVSVYKNSPKRPDAPNVRTTVSIAPTTTIVSSANPRIKWHVKASVGLDLAKLL